MNVIYKAFKSVGRETTYGALMRPQMHYVYDSNQSDAARLRYRTNGILEEFRLMDVNGEHERMYFIVRQLELGEVPKVLQTGIVEYYQGEPLQNDSDSDLNGRAPSAGEVASFIVPLASQIKAGTLVLADV